MNLRFIAHRGHGPTSTLTATSEGTLPPELEPENSLEAFAQAIDDGAHGIELDVFISKDGIPMVIHDDELNINVYQANRATRELGLVSEKTAEELQSEDPQGTLKYPLGPNNEKIPTLKQVIHLVIEKNAVRKKTGKPELIINIELKGTQSIKPIYDLVKHYIVNNLITPESVMYCSFDHELLAEMKFHDEKSYVAPAIKTNKLFAQNDITMPGWTVKENASYDPGALPCLRNVINNLSAQAIDLISWDAEPTIFDFAITHDQDVFLSAANFRPTIAEKDLMPFLFTAAEVLKVKNLTLYYKTDEVAVVRQIKKEYKLTFFESKDCPQNAGVPIEWRRMSKPDLSSYYK